MSGAVELGGGIFWVGVNDRETDLFEALWPMPRGISYNASLVVDEKVALIDAVRAPYLPELLERIRGALPDGRGPDYLVINHIEPDHAGALGVLLGLFPAMRIVGNAKTLDLLAAYHGITDRTLALADGETLDLGRRRLRVLLAPMVHWPETMMTFEETGRVLFSGDLFGGYGALSAGPLAVAGGERRLEDESRRYYANVLGRYSSMVRKALARVDAVDPETVVPSHGPVWPRGGPAVRGWYERWSRHEGERAAVVAYASMYQNTKRMAECVAEGLAAAGVARIAVYDVSRTHPSFILGSHGWSGGAMAQLRELGGDPGWRLIEPVVEVRGAPGGADQEECRRLGCELAAALGTQAAAG